MDQSTLELRAILQRAIETIDRRQNQSVFDAFRPHSSDLQAELAQVRADLDRAIKVGNENHARFVKESERATFFERKLDDQVAELTQAKETIAKQDKRIEELYAESAAKDEIADDLERERNRYRHDFDEVQALLRALHSLAAPDGVTNAAATYLVREVYAQVERVWTVIEDINGCKLRERASLSTHVEKLGEMHRNVCRQLAYQTTTTTKVSDAVTEALRTQITNLMASNMHLRLKVAELERKHQPYGPLDPYTSPEIGWPIRPFGPTWQPSWVLPERPILRDPMPGEGTQIICGGTTVPNDGTVRVNNPDQGGEFGENLKHFHPGETP